MKLMLLLVLFLVACGKDEKSSKSIHFSEDIQMNAAIYSNQIQLSNVLKTTSSSPNVCGPAPAAGKIYTYSVQSNLITIADQQVQVTYQRVTNLGGIYGSWSMVSSTDPRLKSGTMEITYNSVRFVSNCSN